MMTLDQAKEILDTIARQTRMTREEHSLAIQAIGLLYDGAKENQENKVRVETPKITPIDSLADIQSPLRPTCPKTGKPCALRPYEMTCEGCHAYDSTPAKVEEVTND
jgi:hypothetical protein